MCGNSNKNENSCRVDRETFDGIDNDNDDISPLIVLESQNDYAEYDGWA